MEEVTLSAEELQQYDDRCKELAAKYGVAKVHAAVFEKEDTGEKVVCYLKEPNFETKITVMDKFQQSGIYRGAEELRQAVVIKEASDPITYGDAPECDKYKLGVVNFCMGLIATSKNLLKKK